MSEGEIIAGRFAVEDANARLGGIGTVHQGRDLVSGDAVAIKRLRQPDGAELQRFLREAEVLSQLDHPGIVHHVAHGVMDDGTPFLVMEWLQGESLSERIARQPESAGAQPRAGTRVDARRGCLLEHLLVAPLE